MRTMPKTRQQMRNEQKVETALASFVRSERKARKISRKTAIEMAATFANSRDPLPHAAERQARQGRG